MSVGSVRRDLATTLGTLITDATVHSFPPEIVIPPAIVVVPDDPYLDPITIGSSLRVSASWRLTVLAGVADNESSLETLETLAAAVYASIPSGFQVGSCTRPSLAQVGSETLLAAEIPIKASLDLSEEEQV